MPIPPMLIVIVGRIPVHPGILPAGRQHAQKNRKDQYEHEAHDEGRNGKADDRQRDHAAVGEALPVERGIDAGGDTDHQLQDQRRKRQLQRRGHPLQNQMERRGLVAHRHAEISGEDRLDIGEVLYPDRLVETPGFAERVDGVLRHIGTEHHLGRIARHAQHDESEGHDGEYRNHGAHQTHENEADHARLLRVSTDAVSPATA